jgi:hypothetical protein
MRKKNKQQTQAEGTKTTKLKGDLVPKEEKKHQRENNLCIKCGEAGHNLADCTKEWTYKDKGKKPVKGKAAELKDKKVNDNVSTDSESEN